YEKRLLKKEDFNNDAVDAGEIGAGHTVTALYEIVPVGAASDVVAATMVDELKYQRVEVRNQRSEVRGQQSEVGDQESEAAVVAREIEHELLTLKVRYKEPAGDVSRKLEFPLTDRGDDFAEASED